MKKIIKLFCIATVSACSVLFMVSCKTEEGPVDFDPKFSVNVATPMKGWPIEKKLSEVKKQVYAKYGKPDAFHIYWTADGAIQPCDDVRREVKRRESNNEKELPEHSWVYLDKGFEVCFKNDRAVEKKISEQLKIVIKYGDPEEVSRVDKNQWKYYSKGKMYKFSKSGALLEESDFPAMGGNFAR